MELMKMFIQTVFLSSSIMKKTIIGNFIIIQDIKVVNTLNGLSHFETSGFTANENEKKLYLDDIPAGVYYIQLQTNKGQMTKKIVKIQ